MKTCRTVLLVVTCCFSIAPVFGQADKRQIEIPFSNPDRIGLVKLTFDSDVSVAVVGYEGKNVIVERSRGGKKTADAAFPEATFKAIGDMDIDAHEADNVITLKGLSRTSLTVQVPRETSLQIICSRDGEIRVENVDGDIEATGHDGSITVDGGSGPLVASVENGRIIARFDALPATKLISLTSLDGTVELVLGKEAKANITLLSFEGRVNTDFKLDQKQYPPVKSGTKITGTLNGGGAEIHLKTHDGRINLLTNNTATAIRPPSWTTPKQQ